MPKRTHYSKKKGRKHKVAKKNVLGQKVVRKPVLKISPFMIEYRHSKMPFPPLYKCRFNLSIEGQYAAAAASLYSFDVSANSLYLPFSAGSLPASGVVLSAVTGMTIKDAYSTASIMPQGFSNLCATGTGGSGVYNVYRVTGARLKITNMVAGLGDNTEVCIVPYVSNNRPSNFNAATMDRFSVYKLISSGNNNNTLKKYISMSELFGMPKGAVEYDYSGQFDSAANARPGQLATFAVFVRTIDGAVFNAASTIRVQLDYWVQLHSELASLEKTT